MTVSSFGFEDRSSGRARRTNATTVVIWGWARHARSAPPPIVPVAPVRRTFIASWMYVKGSEEAEYKIGASSKCSD